MMKDKREKKVSLIELEDTKFKVSNKKSFFGGKKKENSKYAPLKNKKEWPFDYEINNIRINGTNKHKLIFIKNENDEPCDESNFIF